MPNLDFNGLDTRDFRVSMLALDPGLPTLVQWVVLDGANDGYYEFTAAAGYTEVIISVANVYPSTAATYSYTVDRFSDMIFADDFEFRLADAVNNGIAFIALPCFDALLPGID